MNRLRKLLILNQETIWKGDDRSVLQDKVHWEPTNAEEGGLSLEGEFYLEQFADLTGDTRTAKALANFSR